ncbi:MAG TPA: hypothetical protein VGM32_07525 [Rhodopila sp.]|jgi:hypothetical protein
MSDQWRYQLRVYLPDDLAEVARRDRSNRALRPLADILEAHQASMLCHLEAFENYLAEAEQEGRQNDPLYKWTRATLEDPAKRTQHGRTFELHVSGDAVYPREAADALEGALRPLVGGGLVTRVSRHDTNPAANLPVPAEYR